MSTLRNTLLPLTLAGALAAQAPQVAISIGVRETEAGGGAGFTAIGDNGGSTGGIEWINLDGQMLTLDGTWQKFTFDLANDPVTAFAGSTANGILDGTYGTLEHIRILNVQGVTDPISVWIDDVADTITPMGGSPTTTTFGDFEGYNQGDEVMFQEPSFSGSTSSNLQTGDGDGIDNFVASRSASYLERFQFVDNATTRWVRLTTFNTPNQPNPQIRFDQGSVITFWLRSGDCQANLGSQGPGSAYAELCGLGLNFGETSTYYTAGAVPGSPGALGVSFPNNPDLPIFGGNLVSGSGLFLTVVLVADASGKAQLKIPGSAAMVDFVMQSVFVDGSQPQGLTLTNAVDAQFGQ